ncbi:hypothetical protein [Streptobacillus moniliformis]|uniref:Uncharacterized protein n=1 Tax=Streptobacillus moniliformis (strain ATCC 14647 / DSM 12112 / NCTC 10651 / 9901) TaxID=519441 RepID=D1AXY2_STRM9|nr:hypothetical protein [Streptobacillus moniliformis]ACZ01158.1 hypothetical protein Smon_0685 [Streptobacillus moniliformis DSM 12112]AVL42481.1 hypothetical protein CEP89_00725 [Streptobacillus moniliformis]QXW65907.1 hypothetical protein KX935_01250 [Streptobacillus moniliformis]SQA13690.1 Uncharacterised protein [Streptobacillus moniliformis]
MSKSILERKIPYFYNYTWFVLYDYIKTYGLYDGYVKLIKTLKTDSSTFFSTMQFVSAYMNDYDKYVASLNPDFYDFVDVNELTDNERNVVFILAASMDLRVNKPIFEQIYEYIINDMKLKGDYKEIIAKYILKFRITKNLDYVLQNMINEVFDKNIFYKNLNNHKYVIYVTDKFNVEKSKFISIIEEYFLEDGEKIQVYWGKHFTVLDNKKVSKIDQNTFF